MVRELFDVAVKHTLTPIITQGNRQYYRGLDATNHILVKGKRVWVVQAYIHGQQVTQKYKDIVKLDAYLTFLIDRYYAGLNK